MQVLRRLLRKMKKVDDCWIWTGYTKNGRYGSLCVDGKAHQAHIAAYKRLIGPVGQGMKVLHSCNNTMCIKPHHLRQGTMRDNSQDCLSRGRFRKPIPYKLTYNSLRRIKRLLKFGVPQRKIAAEFGVTQSAICAVNTGRLKWTKSL